MKYALALTLALAGSVALASPNATSAEGRMKPDFSDVKSLAAVQALVRKGRLVRIALFPTELGGADTPENIAYVPPEAAQARDLIVGTLIRFTKEGVVDKLTVTPEYKGDSFVPSRIVVNATHSAKKGSFHPTIEIW